MKLRPAFLTAKAMGRSSSGLTATYRDRVFKRGRYEIEGPVVVVSGRVKGGSQTHKAILAWKTTETEKVVPLKASKQECRYHCDCSDFMFTFYPFLAKKKDALIRIEFDDVKPGKRAGPPRAINEAGMCKHVMALVKQLREDKLIL